MSNLDIDRLAENVMEAYAEYSIRLHGKGRFPAGLFKTFFDAVIRYCEATKDHLMIHREVAGAVSGLRELMELESSRAPGKAIADADRLECMLFYEFDPYFEGNEPSGL